MVDMPVPDAFGSETAVFRSLGGTADERAWLDRLPALVTEFERRWKVETSRPYESGSASWTAPAVMADGTPAVLKVGFPHREARGESTGLRLWGGEGAPLLHVAEPDHYAMLIERCDPGQSLAEADLGITAGLTAATQVLRKLWLVPPVGHGLERLEDVCAEWAAGVRERQLALRTGFDPGVVTRGAELLESLPASATDEVIVHGDANPTNFLTSRRQPWLAIDSKPMVGDPAYDLAPLVLQLGSPLEQQRPERVVRDRFQMAAELVDQPAERLLAWSVARSVESALWYASMGEVGEGSLELETAAMLARQLER